MKITLEIKELRAGYGDLEIIHGINLTVEDKETLLLLSLNGAGKTTLLKTIIGLIRPMSGKIMLNGEDITDLPPHTRTSRGLIFIGEQSIIPTLTVRENLEVASHRMRPADARNRIREAFDIFGDLKPFERKKAASLSGGQRKFLSFAMVVASDSQFLLLDEPSLGLSPAFVKKIIESIKLIKASGRTILLAEQNAGFSELADRVVLMEMGNISFLGRRDEALMNETISKTFFRL
ncbi:MAG: ATP-binding cassette domain-containing protein [Thermoplasmata archaeon]|nr:ATP-binding cassette domain-containing protein [Candidatus Sysuiplasma acidicola]MBX8646767.1 ATP-binding cassette domain-containing protein [Candidatus Sysuiplasma acidicola]MDH2905124.1 ATP-binding cassette domain-containing protein [Methanomassiliicoccales archaeon]